MLDAVVGAVIAVTATAALLSAVQVTESAFDQAGRSPLIEGEVEILRGAGYDASAGSEHRQVLEADLRQLPVQ
jgi:hypothetical protein